MNASAFHTDWQRDDQRLQALDSYDVLGTPPEEAFDRITRLAQKLFDVPIAVVSFIDAHRQWYKAANGLTADEIPLRDTFCQYVLQGGEPVVVSDAAGDQRYAHNPLVTATPRIRSYAGMPIRGVGGQIIGTLCILDNEVRTFPGEQLALLSDLAEMAMDELELRRCAATDSLTGILSRRAFKDQAEKAIALALRYHTQLHCVMFDLDHFKSINDRFGHAAGDQVLKGAVHAVAGELRASDIFGRLGGEEFGVVLPLTQKSGALSVAEKLRSAVQRTPIEYKGSTIDFTASFGVAALDPATHDLEALLAHADAAVYEAKGKGRNQVVLHKSGSRMESAPRRRVLKGGRILFNGGMSTLDCTVRSLSDEGAGIDVSTSAGVPPQFELLIPVDGFRRRCRAEAVEERHLEAAFL